MKGYKIEYKALKLGEHNFSFEVGAELFEAYDYSEVKAGQCRVDIDMIYNETVMTLDVKISGEVVVECDRCLDDCSVAVDYNAPLVVKICSEVPEEEVESDGEVMWLPLSESSLDLTQYIYESIIISLPYQRVHSEGECNKEMMERFSIVSEDEFEEIERRSSAEESKSIDKNELSKLEALKAMMEREDEK